MAWSNYIIEKEKEYSSYASLECGTIWIPVANILIMFVGARVIAVVSERAKFAPRPNIMAPVNRIALKKHSGRHHF